ncbi:MAG: hypothetical protein WCC21_04850 [Candidatus Acidiferrales bacterium]
MSVKPANKAGYCGTAQRVLLLITAFFVLAVSPARSQFMRRAHWGDVTRPLPAGAGEAIVRRACTSCHGYTQIFRVNFDRQDWEQTVNTMVGWGAPVDKKEIPVLVDYMAENFKRAGGGGVVVPGAVEATIKEWELPTQFSMPHDVVFGSRSGFIWVTEQFGNALARFDLKSQQFKEYKLRGPLSGPFTLTEDKQGNLWFTTQIGGFIGRFDPKTGDVKRYPFPGPKSTTHPSSIATDARGNIWFCVESGDPPLFPTRSAIGRLNPKTGEVKYAHTPTPNSALYDIALNADGVPFFTERDSPKLGSIDPETMEIKEYPLPNPKIGTRRLTITPDGVVWYTDDLRGYLGRFDPKNGKFTEWASPSGPRSAPYGITHVGDIIWYSESESNPNMLVRFDPTTEKFQTWPVKSGGGIKDIWAQPDGNLVLTRPRTNGIAYVEITK